MSTRTISADFPFESKYLDVNDSKIHYIDEGEGDPIFSASPGAIITKELAEWSKQKLRNLTVVDIGKGLHFVQEDNPHKIGEELAKWYQAL